MGERSPNMIMRSPMGERFPTLYHAQPNGRALSEYAFARPPSYNIAPLIYLHTFGTNINTLRIITKQVSNRK